MNRFSAFVSLALGFCMVCLASGSTDDNGPFSRTGDGESASTLTDSAATVLPTLVVSAEQPVEVIAPQRLEGAVLQGLNALNVADAMRYFSGVQVKDYGGVGGVKTVDVRGMGSNHTGVFYDGIQITNAQNGQVDLGRFSLDNVEEVAMYNGQKSDIFQPARDFGSASAVYIRTRRPVFTEGKRVNVEAGLRAGSFGLVNPLARVDWRVSEHVSLTASAEYMFATGRYRFRYRKLFSDGTVAWDTTATRHNGMIHALRAEATAFGRFDKGEWMAKGYFYDSSRGIPGAIVNNVWKTAQHQWDRNLFVQGMFRRGSHDGGYEWMVNGKYGRDYLRYLNPDTTMMYVDNTFRQDNVYLSTSHRLRPVAGLDISGSADWQWDGMSSDMRDFCRPRRNTLLGSLAALWSYAGLRVQGSMLLTEVWDRRTAGPASGTGNHFGRLTPALFVSWRPWKSGGLNLHGFYKRIFRMPTFNDLYYTDMGNADLKPEYASQYSAGAEYTLPGAGDWLREVSATCEVYYNRVTDKIIAVPKGTGQFRWMMMNIGEARIFGVDASLRAGAVVAGDVSLEGRLGYSYERARDYSDPADNLDAAGSYRGQIAYIPLHSGSATAHGSWHGAEMNYSFIYVGERWSSSANTRENHVQPWYTHDLSLQYTWPLSGGVSLRGVLEINNLFNQQYEVIENYPMPGRNYRFALRVTL